VGPVAKQLVDICHREDPTRPVTLGCNNPEGAVKSGYAKTLDVFGINYHGSGYKTLKGTMLLLGSETASALSSRGEYGLTLNDKGRLEIQTKFHHQCTSYDLLAPDWGCTAESDLKLLRDSPWVAGEFVWTGFDYLGEPTPYKWPSRSSYFGIVDTCGFPKDRYYLYQSQWSGKPMVHILPHWNWEGFEGKAIPVWCFSNADSVELFLNGKSLGEKNQPEKESLHFQWSVPYAAGSLKAVAKKDGKVVATAEVRTAGKPARLIMKSDRQTIRANGVDLAFVQVRVVDQDGNACPNADNTVAFDIEGPGTIAGVDNGDATSHESFQAGRHAAYHGLCLAVIEAGRQKSQIRLTATAKGIPSATVTIPVDK
jgi:beta-galactosidase